MERNNIAFTPNGRRRKTSYKKGQMLAIVPSTDNDLNISMSGMVVDMPIENIIAEEIPVLLTEEVSASQDESAVVVDEIFPQVVVEEAHQATFTGYTYGDHPVKGKNYNDGFPMNTGYRNIPFSKTAMEERF